MFENYVGERQKKIPQWAIAVVGVAIAIHVVAVGALVIKSFWTINKLGLPEGDITLGAPPPPPPPPPAGSNKKKKVKRTIKKVKEIAQIEEDKPKPEEVETTTSDNEGEGEPGGDPNGVPGGDPLFGVPGGTGTGFGTGGPPPPPKAEPPKIIPQKALEAKRISGTTQVQPPNNVAVKINRAGKKVRATYKFCLNKSGRVKSVSRLASSGHPSYDNKIKGEIRKWKYRPFLVNGKPIEICSTVSFVYKPAK